MVTKTYIFDFLKDLRENNSKEWMDENRQRYKHARECWINEVEKILALLSNHDNRFNSIEPKSTLSRINNNRRFHPNKPIYKDYFTCDPSGGNEGLSSLHISISPGNSFVGAGLHHPSSEVLKKFHQAIDYNGDKFAEILKNDELKEFFGDLSTYGKDLKTAPRGFNTDHPHIRFLRKKSITLMRTLTDDEVCHREFPTMIEKAYRTLFPFNQYLQEAVNF